MSKNIKHDSVENNIVVVKFMIHLTKFYDQRWKFKFEVIQDGSKSDINMQNNIQFNISIITQAKHQLSRQM